MTTTYRHRFLPLLLAALFALALFGAPTARAADAVITGQVVGKNGASGIAGTSVVLEIATAAGGAPQSRTVTARDDGTFRFDGFAFDPNAVYLVKVTYDGGIYFR